MMVDVGVTGIAAAPLRGLVRQVQDRMMETHDQWREATMDECSSHLHEILDELVWRGRELWTVLMVSPGVGALPAPGAMAATLEEVVRDTIKEAVGPTLGAWTDAMWTEDHPDEEATAQ